MSDVLPESDSQPAGVANSRQPESRRRAAIVTGTILVLLLVISIGLIMARRHKPVPVAKANSQICSNAVLQAAASAIDGKNIKALVSSAAKVETIPRHETDPNCMFILLTSSLRTSSPKSARTNFDLLKKIYSPDKGFSGRLGQTSEFSLDTLSGRVQDLEKRASAYNASTDKKVEPGASR